MPKRRIFYGWWVVLATSLIHFWGAGLLVYGFTAFFNPLVEEFRWSYAATSFAASFRSLETGIAGPAVGFLTDRFGARRLILIGSVWTGLGCILLSLVNSLWSFYAVFIFVSSGYSLMMTVPGFTAVTNWFRRRRGVAIGILSAAVGISGALIPLISWLIAQYGWRSTFIIAGVCIWVIGIPLSLVVRHHPERYGYLPDGAEPPAKGTDGSFKQGGPQPEADAGDVGVKQALKTRAFWTIALAQTVSGCALTAMGVHVMPYLISNHTSREVASFIAAAMTISSVVGRLGFGWLGDRMDKRLLMAVSLILQTAGLVIVAYAGGTASIILFLVMFGPGAGGVITLRLTAQGDYFGRKAFGAIQGIMHGIYSVGTILGPVFAGWVYDVSGSYQWAWLVLAAGVLMALPLVLSLGPPRRAAVAA